MKAMCKCCNLTFNHVPCTMTTIRCLYPAHSGPHWILKVCISLSSSHPPPLFSRNEIKPQEKLNATKWFNRYIIDFSNDNPFRRVMHFGFALIDWSMWMWMLQKRKIAHRHTYWAVARLHARRSTTYSHEYESCLWMKPNCRDSILNSICFFFIQFNSIRIDSMWNLWAAFQCHHLDSLPKT